MNGIQSSAAAAGTSASAFLVSALALAMVIHGHTSAETQRELDLKSGGGLFARMWRAAAFEKTKNPRYPSLEKNSRGDLLLLLTYETEGEPGAAVGTSTSADNGRTWSDPRAVYTPAQGTPRALGTLTRLRSGKLLAPFDEGSDAVRLLVSDDDGDTWNVAAPIDCSPLLEAVPYSRIVELDGEILMPVFGKLPIDGKAAPCSGLMRSEDEGATWGDFTAIACDRKAGETAYGPTAVYAHPGGSLLALISDQTQYIHRSTSDDSGRTWSPPEPGLAAHNPALAAIGNTLVCVNYDSRRHGMVRVQGSENLFDSWRCDRTLDANIKGEHFSAVALDADRLLLAYDRGPFKPAAVIRGTVVTKGIEVAMLQRNPAAAPAPDAIIPAEKRDRWELARTLSPPFPANVGAPVLALTPDGDLLAASRSGLFISTDHARTFRKMGDIPENVAASTNDRLQLSLVTMLQSGRILLACTDSSDIRDNPEADWRGTYTRVGRRDGYDRWTLTGVKGTFSIHVFHSDDRGKTWSGGEPIDKKPLVWAYANGRFIEEDDGTVVMMAYGCLNKKDTSGRIDCCGVFRSADAGETWGDFSLVAHDKEFHEIAYNELDIQPMPDGTWTACIRTEWRTMAGGYPSYGSVAFSADRGRTWTKPELTFPDTGFDLELLPDGGLVYGRAGFRSLVMSYDGGHTWSRQIPARTDTYTRLQLLGNGDLLVYGGWGGKRGFIYRRIAASGPSQSRASQAPSFTKVRGPHAGGAVLDVGRPDSFDSGYAGFPTVHFDGTLFRMWYSSWDTPWPAPGGIGLATSADGVNWTRANEGRPVLTVAAKGMFDAAQVIGPCVLFEDGKFMMWYGGMDGTLHDRTGIERIGLATSTDGVHWTRANQGRPVLDVGLPGSYDDIQVAHPCVVREGGSYRTWYSAYSVKADHTFCVARSRDGIHWERENGGKPVTGLSPSRVTGAAVCRLGDRYLMLFSGFSDRWGVHAATSADGIQWRMLYDADTIVPFGVGTHFDARQMHHPCLWMTDDRLRVWYSGDGAGADPGKSHLRIGLIEALLY